VIVGDCFSKLDGSVITDTLDKKEVREDTGISPSLKAQSRFHQTIDSVSELLLP